MIDTERRIITPDRATRRRVKHTLAMNTIVVGDNGKRRGQKLTVADHADRHLALLERPHLSTTRIATYADSLRSVASHLRALTAFLAVINTEI